MYFQTLTNVTLENVMETPASTQLDLFCAVVVIWDILTTEVFVKVINIVTSLEITDRLYHNIDIAKWSRLS